MEKATLSQLRKHLSAYLKQVGAGETILVLDRGKPVAHLVGVERQGPIDDRLARLQREGLVRRALGPVPKALLEEPPPKPGKSVLDALIEERRGHE
jgi:prevent-host-death family protein